MAIPGAQAAASSAHGGRFDACALTARADAGAGRGGPNVRPGETASLTITPQPKAPKQP